MGWLLHCAIYRVKQAPHAWFGHFQCILDIRFADSIFDYAMLTCISARGCVILLLYVDDMIITSDDAFTIASLKSIDNVSLK